MFYTSQRQSRTEEIGSNKKTRKIQGNDKKLDDDSTVVTRRPLVPVSAPNLSIYCLSPLKCLISGPPSPNNIWNRSQEALCDPGQPPPPPVLARSVGSGSEGLLPSRTLELHIRLSHGSYWVDLRPSPLGLIVL